MTSNVIHINNIYKKVIDTMFDRVIKFFSKYPHIGNDHNHIHAKIIAEHSRNACLEITDIDDDKVNLILLTSLLHDTDDDKFFPDTSKDKTNLRRLMSGLYDIDTINKVAEMVDLISSSKHGDKLYGYPEWMFIPRYADRLDAIGLIGVARTYAYAMSIGQPLYNNDTARAYSIEDIYNIATIDRYNNYSNSITMIDHCYDKLIRLGNFPIRNKYFDNICNDRLDDIIQLVLFYGNKGSITSDDCKNFIKDRDPKLYYDMDLDRYN